MEACGLCRRQFERHFVVDVASRVRWRGNSFDAYQAQGKLGLALARVLGLDPSKEQDFARFTREVSVREFREKPGIPSGPFDPAEGEQWEFHVGFLAPVTDEVVTAAARAAVEALATVPNYSGVRVRGE